MAVAASAKNASGLTLKRLSRYSDVFVAFAAVVVVGMMVIPLPGWVLDVLLTLNITGALLILLVTMYTLEPLQFSSFPSLLLLATLFRLALNVSATRLILLHAEAGAVINSFGNFVVGGNYVVGLVVFILLVIIQFVVITNGAGRVAEVAARFTLDAMPGKQMAIDADLNAGIINEEEARQRRKAVAREADFYGAMDGASKFVRGDAIAAIIMVVVNILGGFVVGVVQRRMAFMDALQTYTLLTVGEGLVTQIPALLISTATGLIVTRTTSESSLGADMTGQMLAQPRAMALVAGILLFLGLLPGLPRVPFLMMAAGVGVLAQMLRRSARKPKAPAEEKPAAPKPESMQDLLGVDPLEVEIGYGLVTLADPRQGGELLERITLIRKQVASDLGIIVPPIRVRDNMQLGSNAYAIKLKGVEIARAELLPGYLLAMNPSGEELLLDGIPTKEPAFGLSAMWIPESRKTDAEVAGYTVVDPLTVLITHLGELIRRHAHEILSRQDVQELIDVVKGRAPAVVDELIPGLLTIGEVQKVLANLLRERVSIKDLVTVLEGIADHARITKDPELLTEYVRQAMARSLSRQHVAPDGALYAFTLDPAVEQLIADSVRQTELGAYAVLEPSTANAILRATRQQIDRMASLGHSPVALCSPRVRLHFRRLTERMAPQMAVLSYGEILPDIPIESTGMVTIQDENPAV